MQKGHFLVVGAAGSSFFAPKDVTLFTAFSRQNMMNAIMMKLTTEEMKEDATDTNRIHPAVALGGCIISVMILLLLIVPGSPAFMAPQSFAALIVWVLMGVTFYFVSKKNFAKISKREMDYLILGNVNEKQRSGYRNSLRCFNEIKILKIYLASSSAASSSASRAGST